VQTELTRNTQIAHSSLVEHINRFNPLLHGGQLPDFWSLATPSGLAALNAEVTRQASMIGYVDDFRLLMILTLAIMPFLLLMKPATKQSIR
jgi:DHA2 family multidrug resistance protein